MTSHRELWVAVKRFFFEKKVSCGDYFVGEMRIFVPSKVTLRVPNVLRLSTIDSTGSLRSATKWSRYDMRVRSESPTLTLYQRPSSIMTSISGTLSK